MRSVLNASGCTKGQQQAGHLGVGQHRRPIGEDALFGQEGLQMGSGKLSRATACWVDSGVLVRFERRRRVRLESAVKFMHSARRGEDIRIIKESHNE